jgi:hypothetical protein
LKQNNSARRKTGSIDERKIEREKKRKIVSWKNRNIMLRQRRKKATIK